MTVKLTINDIEIDVPEGTTVLRAAEQAGIDIPTLCEHKHLIPYGGCRLCVVEVEGARTLQPSCTLPVSNGMVVRTDTAEVHKAREFVLALIFSERNHFCMYCQMSGGDCELQNAAYEEDMSRWPLQPNWEPYAVDASHPHFVLDHNRCILCRRCVRACAEMSGNFTLGMQERGADTILVADLNTPLGESTCVSCGSCVQVCPTGALIDRTSAYRGRETDVKTIKTTCAGCSVGCGVELVVRDNQLLRINGNWDAPVNGGTLCERGRFLPLDEDRERIMTPLIRKNGALKAATWDEAIQTVADKLKPLVGKNGHNVAALASTRIPVEGLYWFKQLFADGLGSEMVTSIEEGITTALPGLIAQERGQSFEGSLDALKEADCVVAVGVDLVANHQVAGFLVKRNLANGTKLVSIDPFENGLHKLADHALQPAQGTDLVLLDGLKAVVNGSVASLSKISEATGILAETVQAVGKTIAAAQKPVFVYGKGVTREGTAAVMKALLDLVDVAGENAAIIGTKGQANSLAAHQYGLDRLFEASGRRAVYLALGDDKPSRRLLKRLEGVPFVAVQASHMSPATSVADVVLPTEMWTEQEGHFLNLDGRLQEIHRGLTPPADIRSHVDVLQTLAEEIGLTLNEDWQDELKKRVSIVARFDA
jgi:formate dehydrogenase major subunit